MTYFRPLGGGLAALYFPVSRPIANGESEYQPSFSAEDGWKRRTAKTGDVPLLHLLEQAALFW